MDLQLQLFSVLSILRYSENLSEGIMKDLYHLIIFSGLIGFLAADQDLIPLTEAQASQCVGKNGVFLPIAGSCNQFIICVDGSAVRSTCGKYHFNARRSMCDLPENAGCMPSCVGQVNGVKIPMVGSTSKYFLCMQEKAFEEYCGALRFDEKKMLCVARNEEPVVTPCLGLANGMKVPNPENPRQYYFCMNDKAFLKDCGHLYFDSKYSACVLYPEVEPPKVEMPSVFKPSKQVKLIVPISNQDEPPYESPKVEIPSVFNPSKQINFNVPIFNQDQPPYESPKVEMPSVFKPSKQVKLIVPISNQDEPPYESPKVEIPSVFNPSKQINFNVPIFNQDQPPYESPKVEMPSVFKPSKQVKLIVPISNQDQPPYESNVVGQEICKRQLFGARVAAPGSCSDYYVCLGSSAVRKSCNHLHFNPIDSSCDEPSNVHCIVEANGVVYGSKETAQLLSPESSQPQEVNICSGQRDGIFIAAPNSCSDYYVCLGSSAVRKSCNHLHFNPIDSSCDEPSNVHCIVEANGVVYGSKETAQLLSPESSQPQEVNICSGQRDGIFIAAPGHCSEFYFCFMNHAFRQTCGALHFSPITQSCVELEMSNCVDGSRVAQAKIIEANSCLSRQNGVLLKHPTDCGKYLICDNHVPVEMICPAGLHFNTERDYCDWPELAKCF